MLLCAHQRAKELFPTLATEYSTGKSLKGAICYYDGQFNDARYALALATTAVEAGATCANHMVSCTVLFGVPCFVFVLSFDF